MQTTTSTKTQQILSILNGLDAAHAEAFKALWELSPDSQPVPGSELDAAFRAVNAASFTVTNSMTGIRKASTTPAYRRWSKGRDKYGRTVRTVEEISTTHRQSVGAIVNLPRVYVQSNPGKAFMVNEYRKGPDGLGEVTYHADLRSALAHMAVGNVELQQYDVEPKS